MNLATVTGRAGLVEVSATATVPVRVLNPALNIAKAVNGAPGDDAPGLSVEAGDTLTFSFVVTNPSSDDTVTGITVKDDRLCPVVCPLRTLGPGASMTCTPLLRAPKGH